MDTCSEPLSNKQHLGALVCGINYFWDSGDS
jgi:hypothetical protein